MQLIFHTIDHCWLYTQLLLCTYMPEFFKVLYLFVIAEEVLRVKGQNVGTVSTEECLPPTHVFASDEIPCLMEPLFPSNAEPKVIKVWSLRVSRHICNMVFRVNFNVLSCGNSVSLNQQRSTALLIGWQWKWMLFKQYHIPGTLYGLASQLSESIRSFVQPMFLINVYNYHYLMLILLILIYLFNLQFICLYIQLPQCLKQLSPSAWNPPPGNRRLAG